MRRWFAIGLGGLALASCGGGGEHGLAAQTPAQIASAAIAAIANARTVHLAGAVSSAGQTITINVRILLGHGERGSMAERGSSVQLVVEGNLTYLKASAGFARQFGGASSGLVAGRWLMTRGGNEVYDALINFANIAATLTSGLENVDASKLSKGATTTVDGRRAIPLGLPNGSTVFIAASGRAFPIAVRGTTATGLLRFTDWNAPVALTLPRGAVDITGSLP